MSRANPDARASVQVRATFYILWKMRCFTFEEIKNKLIELYGFTNLDERKKQLWLQENNRKRMETRLHNAHPQVYCQYLMFLLKDTLLMRIAQNLKAASSGGGLEKDLNVLMKGITLIYNMDKGVASTEELKPESADVIKNFLDKFTKTQEITGI